ncbi:gp41 protein [Thysanoplusia orichalcea nucleopolyhedrovirus]|uniref:Gp41 protein n=1 Tax=Thysanoplusia orichalcea nucleopolyhedrovirus TaxID=101850 RepID=L0CLW8_9ABAC|nr:gp41 protein [Thysanoplusia orichalcea nucleopolyhedrovirus]AGA16231.1 gp41 protein [Thysanoplusia orichalcea nucleopolyhedrovirus]
MTDERGNFYYNAPSPLRYPSNPATAIFTNAQTYSAPGYASPPTVATITTNTSTVTRDNRMDYASRSNSANSVVPYNKAKESALDTGESIWYNKCVDFVQKIIRYYRCNDMAELSPLMILFINTIRDMCIDTNPISVNVVKRFESEETMIRHLIRLQKELGQNSAAESLSSDSNIFQPSFVLNSLPAYAQKFYNGGADMLGKDALNEAAKQLSVAVQYMVAEAVTCNIPIPLPFNQQLANNYMTLLLKHATLPPNIQSAVESRRFPHINMINDLVNSVIEDLFAGGGDYYHYVLNEKNRARVMSLKENVAFLAPLSASANIFNYMAELATRAGKQPSMFQNATFLTSAANAVNSPAAHLTKSACQDSLTELAFQNETLRRFIFQQINYNKDANAVIAAATPNSARSNSKGRVV